MMISRMTKNHLILGVFSQLLGGVFFRIFTKNPEGGLIWEIWFQAPMFFPSTSTTLKKDWRLTPTTSTEAKVGIASSKCPQPPRLGG